MALVVDVFDIERVNVTRDVAKNRQENVYAEVGATPCHAPDTDRRHWDEISTQNALGDLNRSAEDRLRMVKKL